MTRSTPGPWEVVRHVGLKVHRSEPIPKGRRYAIAQLGVGRGDSEDEANARLISAAPDLLEALKAAIAVSDTGESDIRGLNWKQIEAAIAKAEGP